MDHIITNMKKIREMKKEEERANMKPQYSLSYIKLITGTRMEKDCLNCDFKKERCSKCYDKLIHSITDMERVLIWTTPFDLLLKDVLKNVKITKNENTEFS